MTADAHALEREARQLLADALGQAATLHEPGQRERFRSRLERAIELGERVLADDATGVAARATLARAHAARAEDARHGAGQLSMGAQRAPTREACDDGWQRVEVIVAVAEASARAAARMATELEDGAARSARAARRAAQKADVAARDARRIVDARNHAYTFHADGGFSFGEGWYVAAAGVLAGAAIQIEPAKPATSQAERFLRDAGLSGRLQDYRSRPRAVKQTTELVARAFRADPATAQRTLRAAFLGEAPRARSVTEWVDRRVSHAATPATKKVLLWVRDGVHHPARNTTPDELAELVRRAIGAGLVPVLIGEAVREEAAPAGALDLTLFRTDPIFRGEDARRAQLQLFEHLREAHGVVGQLGVTTAGMDGPALMGLPTTYLTEATNVRMREWVGAVPGYREIVRDGGYLDRVSDTLSAWANRLVPA